MTDSAVLKSQKQLQDERQTGMDWIKRHEISGISLSFDELLMYRNFTHLLSNKPNSKVKHQMSGQYLAKTKGRGMEFDEARHYQPGDDVRTIDWRVTARTGKTHTKIFREEKDRPVFVFCDLLPSMRFGSQLLFKSVQACHLSALIAWTAKKRGDKIGGLILSEQDLYEVKPRSSQQAVLHWLTALKNNNNALPIQQNISVNSVDKQTQEQKFIESCAHLRRVAHPGSLVYIISDLQHLTNDALQHLYQLQKHCEVVACWINDPIEKTLPKSMSGLMPVTNGNQTKVVNNTAQLLDYKRKAQQHFLTKKDTLEDHNIKWLSISAGQPLSEQL